MKFIPIVTAVVLAFAVAAPATARDSKTTAKDFTKETIVNGTPIPRSRYELLLKARIAQGRPDNAQLREAVRNELIAWELVVQQAKKKGMDKRADVLAQLDVARQQIIFQDYVRDYLKAHPIKEGALRTEYDRLKARRGKKEYKASHILVSSEAAAKKIIAQLDKGAKFATLAKQSKDIGTRDKGGQLEWQPASTFVKPFGDALKKLKKGQITQTPVKTRFGYHVIRLDDVRAAHFPAFDDVKHQLTVILQRQQVQKLVMDLRAKAKIK